MLNRSLSFILAVLTILTVSIPAAAQQLNVQDRNRYVTQIRAYKHDFLEKELNLSKEQKAEFFNLYDKMEDCILDLGAEVRETETKALADNATPDELDAAAATLFSQKLKEGEIEKEYFDKFKNILSARQLVQLKVAERKFNQELMRQHRRIRGEKMDNKERRR